MRFKFWRYAAIGVGLALTYFAAAELGLSLASLHTNVSPVWPPTGIAIAALLIFGWRLWPAVFVGAFAANFWTHVSVATAAGIATGNTLECLTAFWLLNRDEQFPNSFSSLRTVFKFVLYAAITAPLVSATIGNVSLCLGGAASWNNFPRLWLTWWLGDGFGALVIAPFIVAWSGKGSAKLHKQTGEATLLLTMLFVTALVVLGGWFPGSEKNYPLAHLCLPFLLWAALRFDQRVVTTAVVVLAGVAVWGTTHGYGPFSKGDPNESLLLLQAFIGSSTLTSLVLFAVTDERRRAEEEKQKLGTEVQLHRRRIDDIVANAPGVVWEAWGEPSAATQRINFVSSHVEDMVGYSKQEWLSIPNFWLSIVHRDDRERAASEAAQIFASGKGGTSRFRWVTKDRREIWVEARSIVVCDENGTPVGMRGITVDITAAVKAEDERNELLRRAQEARSNAEEASRSRDEFLATVSHELRTPLNAVVGWSRLLRSGQLDAKGVEHALEVIERNVWAQKQIVEDMLDVSRIISGKLNLNFVPVDLMLVVHSAIDVVRPAADAKNIKLQVKAESTEVTVKGDSDRLQQVAWNLLSNAVKFTPAGGTVEISLKRESTQAELTVMDDGPGIPTDFLLRIFERFTQADNSSTRRHGGLGLGLAIVRHLVELHGGTVQARNREKGSGAIFTVSLPAANTKVEQFNNLLLNRSLVTEDSAVAD